VNPYRAYERKTSRPREFTRKPLGQEKIHPSESLPRVRKENLSASRPRELKENLSAKEEFTQVNPCREYERKASRPREFERKPLRQGRIHPSESLPRERKKNLSAKSVRKKTSRPRKNSPK